MMQKSIWQESCELADSLLVISSGIELPMGKSGCHWVPLVAVGLAQANERLSSIKLLLDRDALESAVILVRSLFELSINLAYINKDVTGRIGRYLEHGKIPRDGAEALRLQNELEEMERGERSVTSDIPTRPWKSAYDMCVDLGPDWLEEHGTMYRFSSISVHAGAFSLGNNYLRLSERRRPSDSEKASDLLTAIEFHSRVADIAARTFPDRLDLNKIIELRIQCGKLGIRFLQARS